MRKIILAFCMAVMFICCAPLSVHAAEKEVTTVEHTVDGSYAITIPDYIEADAEDLPLTISNAVIPYDNTLSVSVEYDGHLKLIETESIQLSYRLYADDSEIKTGDTVLSIKAGTPDETTSTNIGAKLVDQPKYAGIYTSTARFNVEVYEQVRTDYTLEEIEENNYLEGIGFTKPEYVVAHFNEDYTSVTITANGEESDGRMCGWDAGESPFTAHKDTLKNVVIKEEVVNTGRYAFYECTNIEKVELPDGIERILDYAFGECHSLTEINLPDSLKEIGRSCFYNCSSLRQVRLPRNLTEIDFGVFSGCSSLEYVDMGDKIEEIGGNAFLDCTSLKEIEIPASVTEIGLWAFRSCSSLKEIILPDSIVTLGSASISQCTSLQSIKLPENLKTIPDNFLQGCSALERIDFPDSVTRIGERALANCRNIVELKLPDNLTELGDVALGGMNKLQSIEISPENKYFCVENNLLFDKSKSVLLLYPSARPDTTFTVPAGVTEISAACFGLCENLSDLYVPETVISIGDYMFSYSKKPLVHTPSGSTMESYCVANEIEYDNNMG